MQNKCLVPLSMLYLSFLTASMLLSYRFVNIGSILTVASVFVIPFSYSISDIIAEIYGYGMIRKVIWSAFLASFFLFLTLWILVKLPALPKYDNFTHAYHIVFGDMMRVYFSNFLGLFLGVFLNSYVIVKLKLLVKGRLFFVRSLFSSALGELIFTGVVITAVQRGISSSSEIAEMVAVSFTVKMIFTCFSAFFSATLLKPLIEKIEGKNQFVNTESYNPFNFQE